MTWVNKIKLGAMGLAAAVIVGLAFYSQSLAGQRDKLTAEANNLVAVNQRLVSSLAGQYKALRERENEAARLRGETARYQKELEKIYADNKEAGQWGGVCLPGPVYELLLRQAGSMPAD